MVKKRPHFYKMSFCIRGVVLYLRQDLLLFPPCRYGIKVMPVEVEEKVTTATRFSSSIDLTFLSLNALDPASTLSVLLYLTLPPSGPSRAIAAYSTWKGEETRQNKLRFESLAKVCMAS